MDKNKLAEKVEILLVGINFNKGGKPDARKESNFLIKEKCYSLKEQNTERYKR
jgi:hypothetical protein